MLINEIFKSISGESWQAGYPAIFIRAFGCPLSCTYCDTEYSCKGDDFKDMSISEILDKVQELGGRRVVFTGGEPLIQKDATELVQALSDNGYIVEIETCGAVNFDSVRDIPNVYITMDWKSKSSGMNDRMLHDNLYRLRSCDVLKFVVSSKEDMDDMVRIAAETEAQCFVSPVFGKIEPKEIVEYIIANSLDDIRFQLQIHKFVWPVDMRGV